MQQGVRARGRGGQHVRSHKKESDRVKEEKSREPTCGKGREGQRSRSGNTKRAEMERERKENRRLREGEGVLWALEGKDWSLGEAGKGEREAKERDRGRTQGGRGGG